MKFGVFFKKNESMGISDFSKWKTVHSETYEIIKKLNLEAQKYCLKHQIEDGIISDDQDDEAKQILQELSTLASAMTLFDTNLDYACEIEGLGDNWDEEGYLLRYPGLELKDYTSNHMRIFSAKFHDISDIDSATHKLWPDIMMAEGIIEIPINLPENFIFPEGVTPFRSLFEDMVILLADCCYDLQVMVGSKGFYEVKD